MPIDREKEKAFLRTLRKNGILEDIDSDRLPELIRKGTQIVPCADSDYFDDIYQRHILLSGCQRCAPLNHYGGALVIPSHSPAASLGQDLLVKEQLFFGYALGKGDVQVHASHFPCGIAFGYGLDARKSLLLLCDAKDDVLAFFNMRLKNIKSYLDAVARLRYTNIPPTGEICLESKLPPHEVLAIERVIRCSSMDKLRSVVMPPEENFLSHYHVDWGDRNRSYHLNRNMYRKFVGEMPKIGAH